MQVVTSCGQIFIGAARAALKTGLIPPLAVVATRIWEEVSTRWFLYNCPPSSIPGDILFKNTLHLKITPSTKGWIEKFKTSVGKICREKIVSVQENPSDRMGSSITLSHECKVRDTEFNLEQQIKAQLNAEDREITENELYQSCNLIISRGLDECDPKAKLTCAISDHLSEIKNVVNSSAKSDPKSGVRYVKKVIHYSPNTFGLESSSRVVLDIKSPTEIATMRYKLRVNSVLEPIKERAFQIANMAMDSVIRPIMERAAQIANKAIDALLKFYMESFLFTSPPKLTPSDLENLRLKSKGLDRIRETIKKISPNPTTLEFNERNPYSILGLNSDADARLLHKAYKNLLLQLHPDKQGKKASDNDLIVSKEATRLVLDAYKSIKNRRKALNRDL